MAKLTRTLEKVAFQKHGHDLFGRQDKEQNIPKFMNQDTSRKVELHTGLHFSDTKHCHSTNMTNCERWF